MNDSNVYLWIHREEGGVKLSLRPLLEVSFQALRFKILESEKLAAHGSGQRVFIQKCSFGQGPLLPLST